MNRSQIMQDLFGDLSEEENEEDGEPDYQNQGQAESQGEPGRENGGKSKGVYHNQARNSRLPDKEKEKQVLLTSAEYRDIFGDFDDDKQEAYSTHKQTNQKISPKDKGKYIKDLKPGDIIPDEGMTKLKGKAVVVPLVFDIPRRSPLAHTDKMATFNISNIIGIDPKPFDPSTYVEVDFYATDTSGARRDIPSTNIIRWRKVTNPDATTSIESNARFVTWSDGSLQLLIGNEAFDVAEQDVQDIQSHLFLINTKGIYHDQGRISRKMKFMPSSLSSNSHCLFTAVVDSRNKKTNKVQHCIADVDPEWEIQQKEKAGRRETKSKKLLNQKNRKVTCKYTPKGHKECRLTPGFDKDASDEVCKDAHRPTSSRAQLTRKQIYYLKNEKVESEHDRKLEEAVSNMRIEEMQNVEEEIFFEDSEVASEKINVHQGLMANSKKSGSSFKKQHIVRSEDSSPGRTSTCC